MVACGASRSPRGGARRRCASNRAEHELGADGSALVHDVLILGMTMEQVGQRRGLCTQRWQDYFARRLGLATASRVPGEGPSTLS